MVAGGCIWLHLVALGYTLLQLDALGFTFFLHFVAGHKQVSEKKQDKFTIGQRHKHGNKAN